MTEPAFVDHRTVAQMLGITPDALYRKRASLVATGFPDRDPLIGKYLRADVEAWINKRRRLRDEANIPEAPGTNFGAI